MASPTGVVFDSRFTRHDTGPGHPERPERILALETAIRAHPDLVAVAPRAATVEEIALAHDGRHVERVALTRNLPSYAFDPDTPVSPESYETALLAAGGVLDLLDEVMAGRLRTGFAFVRPPGHHAERNRAMGFCLFNNIAVGAAHLRRRHGLERVLVVDWDVHHGNGTQQIFERDPGVLFISTHQSPLYPGTGAVEEVGESDGEGFTVNLPLPAGCGDAEYAEAFRTVIEPVARQYAPQFILISAGFDAHVHDPLAGMCVTADGFGAMARTLAGIADDIAGGRCVAVLEGGYDLRALRDSASAVLGELQGFGQSNLPDAGASRATPFLNEVRDVQGRYWRF